MAVLADAIGEVISLGLKAATWRTKVILPLIPSSASRRSDGAFTISVFSVIIA
ncbi:hypothetical protein [Primorskyibacter sedentarius]|uniref:hypothetical protein n=1 Tax=Primorskyibacter sedentarius TaxID=745311 RepID=UPI001FB3DF79|nr:hypothetical protein [Primorskyibacter sedentarius]